LDLSPRFFKEWLAVERMEVEKGFT